MGNSTILWGESNGIHKKGHENLPIVGSLWVLGRFRWNIGNELANDDWS
jgi:hypothetical protein